MLQCPPDFTKHNSNFVTPTFRSSWQYGKLHFYPILLAGIHWYKQFWEVSHVLSLEVQVINPGIYSPAGMGNLLSAKGHLDMDSIIPMLYNRADGLWDADRKQTCLPTKTCSNVRSSPVTSKKPHLMWCTQRCRWPEWFPQKHFSKGFPKDVRWRVRK